MSKTSNVTKPLCSWIETLKWEDIPEEVRERCKFLILDGLGCAILGSHLPWSAQAVEAVLRMESPGGDCPLLGWKDRKTGPLPAALLNSAFIQAFELDDWHGLAPLHSNAIILPALLSLASHQKTVGKTVSGQDLLLGMITGCEVGPRVGLAVGGGEILSRGWHSGTVFGHPASAAACSKLLGLDKNQIEDAFGIACTQACGLMSAQFESSVKRMQHGFAAKNGLFSALIAESRYKGISTVFDRGYGGYLNVFTLGASEPAKPNEVLKELSETWQLMNMNIKPYACMAGIHATIDCVKELQTKHTLEAKDIKKITIELGGPAFHHGGWQAERPLTEMGAQMNNAYIAAAQIIDHDINMKTFASANLNRDELWELIPKIQCQHREEVDQMPRQNKLCTRMTVEIEDGQVLQSEVIHPKGVKKQLTAEEIIEKFCHLTRDLLSPQQQQDIIQFVSHLDQVEDSSELFKLFNLDIANPIA